VDVQPEKVGPYLVGQTPSEGERLELSPTIQFVFDREMDQAKTWKHLGGCSSDV
jgi:beta-lactam-binding protein with PASTA domain